MNGRLQVAALLMIIQQWNSFLKARVKIQFVVLYQAQFIQVPIQNHE